VICTWKTYKVWYVNGKLTRCDRYMGNLPITFCKFPMYLSHLVSFSCTYHILSVSLVLITSCQFLMFLSHLVGFWCTYYNLHGKLRRCDRYMGNWEDVIGTWETDKVWWVHGELVSLVPVTSCQFPMYISHFVSFPWTHHTLSVSRVPITSLWNVHGKLTRCDRYMGNWQDVIGTRETDNMW
jgi:hypothetical protein